MSDPAHCSRETPCPRFARFLRVMVVYWGLILVLSVAILASVVAHGRADEPARPAAPADPSPSAPATSGPPRPAPSPTAPMPPDPTGTACNIFDPECDPGSVTAQ